MTNEEWWAKIEKTWNDSNARWILGDALRAVMELHPMIEKGEQFTDGDRYGVTIYMCGKCNVPYPCEDIQAIEKELK